MTIRLGINGFGRMGRLVLRAAYDWPDIEFVHINEPAGDATALAHLLTFDSVQGRWKHNATSEDDRLLVQGRAISTSRNTAISDTDWSSCDVVIEASGVFRKKAQLDQYLEQGVKHVVVTAPVADEAVPDIVIGVNHRDYDLAKHPIITAASCTTNCLAPVVKVIHENLGIRHGSMTTIHDVTNTQRVLDLYHSDLRRARSASQNLIPTSTGSAKAITRIFPDLEGKLNGHAVRVPLANASLTDCVFEVSRATTADEVNAFLQASALGELAGILGFEERPLVSTDYCGDPRSSIIDAASTMVIGQTQVKLYAWYDNEWGYVNRTAELVRMVAGLPTLESASQ
jgi:glyceraldehyde-3-phosphate dehydrogenase (arsenate-transferring)